MRILTTGKLLVFKHNFQKFLRYLDKIELLLLLAAPSFPAGTSVCLIWQNFILDALPSTPEGLVSPPHKTLTVKLFLYYKDKENKKNPICLGVRVHQNKWKSSHIQGLRSKRECQNPQTAPQQTNRKKTPVCRTADWSLLQTHQLQLQFQWYQLSILWLQNWNVLEVFRDGMNAGNVLKK